MNKIEIKNAKVYEDGHFTLKDVVIPTQGDSVSIDGTGKYLLPGFVDLHVHFRQPGFEQKETIKTGSLAAAAGGYTTVCTMPNLKPVPSPFKISGNLKFHNEFILSELDLMYVRFVGLFTFTDHPFMVR